MFLTHRTPGNLYAVREPGRETQTMQIQPLSSPPNARPAAPAPEPQTPAEPVDLMVGAPTGRLSPLIPPPQRFPVPVALEIADGIGIGLDGESLVVGHDSRPGRITIVGHLQDGTFPQRDFTISRDGFTTTVDGHYDWQDYRIVRDGASTRIENESPRESSTVTRTGDGLQVDNPFAAGRFQIRHEGAATIVDCEYDGNDYKVSREGNVTRIEGPIPERSFQVTSHDDGSATVDGHYAFQDFTITPTDKGFLVQGHHPQQRFEVSRG